LTSTSQRWKRSLLEHLFAGRERAQVAGDGEGLRSLRGNRLGGDREIFRR
jgi:hypothetical protein